MAQRHLHRKRIHRGWSPLVALAFMTMPFVAPVWAADDHPGRSLAANCTGCHGTQGRSVGAIPSITGLERGYIVNAMKEFKSGARQVTIMHQHAKGYSDADYETLADYFSSQKAR